MSQAGQDLTGRSRIISNVLTGWLSYLVFFISGFFLPRLIDNQLGQVSLGIWDFSWSLVHYISLSALGIGSSLNRFVAKYRAEGNERALSCAVSTVVAIQFVLSLVVLAVTVVLVYIVIPVYFSARFGEETALAQGVVFFLGASLAIQFAFDTSRGVLTGCHRWDLFNGLNSLCYMISVILMIIALFMGYGLQSISFIYMLVTAAQGVVRSYLARRICPEATFSMALVSPVFAKEILPFGIKSIVIAISPLLIVQTTFIIIASTLGPAALAIFARPISLVKHIETFITRFTFVLTPMAGSLQALVDTKELQQFTTTCARYGYAFTLPVMILFCFYGGELIRLWMGSGYVHTDIILLIGLGFLLPISQSPIIRILIGLDYHGKAAALSITLTVGIYVVGAAMVAMNGWTLEALALLTAVTTALVNGIAVPIYACYKLGISVRYYVKAVFGNVTLIGLVAMSVLVLLDRVAQLDGAFILANILCFGLITAVLYWFFLLSDDIKQTILRQFSKLGLPAAK